MNARPSAPNMQHHQPHRQQQPSSILEAFIWWLTQCTQTLHLRTQRWLRQYAAVFGFRSQLETSLKNPTTVSSSYALLRQNTALEQYWRDIKITQTTNDSSGDVSFRVGFVDRVAQEECITAAEVQPSVMHLLKAMNDVVIMCNKVKQEMNTPFDHPLLLEEVWMKMFPDSTPAPTLLDDQQQQPTMTTRDWRTVGFQRANPQTDFRGSGVFGCQAMLFFVTHYPERAQATYGLSHHPTYAFPYGMMIINIVSMLFALVEQCDLLSHFLIHKPTRDSFLRLVCCCSEEFAKQYVKSQPENIMCFGAQINTYRQQLIDRCQTQQCVFDTNSVFANETIE